jgi:sigma-B regulation protein RsbQ
MVVCARPSSTAAFETAWRLNGMADAVLKRHNVRTFGRGTVPMVFAHGFGCDQNMWRFITPAFERDYRIVLFDYLGHGRSDASGYDPARYAALDGYASDVLSVCAALEVRHGVFVGHSVSAMIGALASAREPERFDELVMIGPSPRYINEVDYVGGFSAADIDELLETLESNYLGWSTAMAPVIMGRPDRPEFGEELANSFCRTDPAIARQFARATFLSDNRQDLAHVRARTLILQCANDVIAPECVGRFVHERVPDSVLVNMDATGHCPNLSAPDETIAAMRAFLAAPSTTNEVLA